MINKATFSMLDLDAGLKWRGWSLEGEYYFRWLDDFKVTGSIPVTSLFDHGFQVYASTMLKPNYWQAYFSGSKIFGEYGDPWDAAVGLDVLPVWPQGGAHERSGSLHGPFGSRLYGSSVRGRRHRVGLHGRRWHLVLKQAEPSKASSVYLPLQPNPT